jgi:hypothetical protein
MQDDLGGLAGALRQAVRRDQQAAGLTRCLHRDLGHIGRLSSADG